MIRRGRIRLGKAAAERMRTFALSQSAQLPAVKARPGEAARKEEPFVQEEKPAWPQGIVCRTDRGLVREVNEDAVLVAEGVYGVADGMGGHNAGEIASGRTRDLLLARLKDQKPDAEALRQAVEEVNAELFEAQQESKALSGMGTTLTVLWVSDQRVFLAHVGDSRAYLLRDGRLTQITTDHSYVEEMIQQGFLTRDQAASSPFRNVITRAVATDETVEADILEEERRPGDIWLLCTDGLHGLVTSARIKETLESSVSADEAADRLLALALQAGGTDNVSFVIWQAGEVAS